MSKEITIFRLPMPNAANGKRCEMIVEVNYRKGGTNVFNGNNERRGYELCMRAVEVDDRGFEMFGLSDKRNGRMFIEEARQFSAKRLAALAEELKKPDSVLRRDVYDKLLEILKSKGAIILEEATQDNGTQNS